MPRPKFRAIAARGRQASWGVFDQGISSLMSLAIGVVAARRLPAAEFGAFALALSAYWICLGTSRALTSEPFVVRFSARRDDFRARASDAAGAAIAVGVALGGALVLVGVLAPLGVLGEALVAIGAVLPLLLLQDCLRFVAFAARRGGVAFAADLAWFTALLSALAIVGFVHADRVWIYVLVWGGSAAPAAAVGCARLGVRPRLMSTTSWWLRQRDLVWRYLGEFTALNGAGQLSLYAIGWIAGLSAAGGVRGAQILMGPMTTLFIGISLFALPEGVRQSNKGTAEMLRFSRSVSGLLGVLAALWIGVLVLFHEEASHVLLGASSTGATRALPGVVLALTASGLTAGAFIGLRAYAAAKRSLWVRVAIAPLTLAGAAAGAALDGARGGALGLALAAWIGLGLWWWQFGAELRSRRAAAVHPHKRARGLAPSGSL
jgi:hypothetical protein